VLDQIEAAMERLRGVAHRTPVLTSRQLNEISGAEIFIKCENLQRGGAFKFRGAYNTISQLSEQQKKVGVITHSSGNHAQAVAITGGLLGIPTVIIMPNNAPQVKINATRGYGAEVVLCEPTQEARESTVQALIDEKGYTLIHPYDNDNIIAGAATTALELLEDVPNLDILVGPVGGGGLIAGSSAYAKLSGKVPYVIAVEPRGADDAFRSFYGDEHITSQNPITIADGLRTTTSKRTLRLIKEHVDRIIKVTDAQIIEAVGFMMERMKIVAEPSGASTVAPFLFSKEFAGKRIGIIISGGNMDISVLKNSLVSLDNSLD
jgi:threonine dehydratase